MPTPVSAPSQYSNSAGPYVTQLSPAEESKFQTWVSQNKIPFDPSPYADYDMRGYWKSQQGGAPAGTKTSDFDGRLHFPDTFKTPYHKTFSNESIYATKDAPGWQGDKLVDQQGRVLADETPKVK
jgi:hypothetical protein